MNIDDALNKTAGLQSVAPQQKRSGDAGNAVGSGTAGAGAAATEDSVRLSPQYQALGKAIAGSSSFNAEKVASIKAAIANGEYTVDAGKIANGVLQTAADLINSRLTS